MVGSSWLPPPLLAAIGSAGSTTSRPPSTCSPKAGRGALTTTNVCERLGVTTGSLYHHFESGPAFYAAVIDHWENVLSLEVRNQADQAGDAVDRLQALHDIALFGNHDAEKAIRAWASSDPMVAAAQQRVDEARAATPDRRVRRRRDPRRSGPHACSHRPHDPHRQPAARLAVRPGPLGGCARRVPALDRVGDARRGGGEPDRSAPRHLATAPASGGSTAPR